MLNREFRNEKLKQVVNGTFIEGLDENTVAYNYIRDNGYGLPIYLGQTAEGKPYLMDLTEESSTLITGCSGSGKSWTAYLLALNILAFNDYTDVHIRVLDGKKSLMWHNLTNLPNVHDCTRGTLAELKSIVEVIEEREELLKDLGIYANFKEYKETGKSGLGYVVVILDEYKSTLGMLRETNLVEFEEVREKLQYIAQVGKTYGVHLITVGQQPTVELLGRKFIGNSTTRIGLKPVNHTDTVNLFGNVHVETIKSIGVANVRSSTNGEIQNVKIATLGTKEEDLSQLIDSLKGLH